MTTMHGWFSIKQKNVVKFFNEKVDNKRKQIFYLNMNGEKVEVTEVTRTKEYGSKFDDVIYLGILKEYCRPF